MKLPIPDDNCFPTIYFCSRFFWGFSVLFCLFCFPLAFSFFSPFQHQPGAEQKKINDLVIAPMLKVWTAVIWSRVHCTSLHLRPWRLRAEHTAPVATVGADAGRLASKRERWKASSNRITDGLSVPFELFTDWVNDYRQCVSWPGARICYPPIRYYQRALPCLAGVLPNHLTEMPTQKEECSECARSLSWGQSKKSQRIRHELGAEGAEFPGVLRTGERVKVSASVVEPASLLSSLGGAG